MTCVLTAVVLVLTRATEKNESTYGCYCGKLTVRYIYTSEYNHTERTFHDLYALAFFISNGIDIFTCVPYLKYTILRCVLWFRLNLCVYPFRKKPLRYIITTTKTVYSLHFVSRQAQCSNISLLSYRDVSICYGSCSFQGIDAFSVNSRFSIKQPIYTVIRCQYPTPNVCVIVYACCLYHLFQRRLSVRQ